MRFLNGTCSLIQAAHSPSLVKRFGALAWTAAGWVPPGQAPLAAAERGGAAARRRGVGSLARGAEGPASGRWALTAALEGAWGRGGTQAKSMGSATRPAAVFQRSHSARPPFSSLETTAALKRTAEPRWAVVRRRRQAARPWAWGPSVQAPLRMAATVMLCSAGEDADPDQVPSE